MSTLRRIYSARTRANWFGLGRSGRALRLLLCGLVTGSLLICAAGCPKRGSVGPGRGGKARAERVTIGAFMCNTGDNSTYGQSCTKGMGLRVKEINEGGGALGKPLRLIVLDDQSKQEEVASAVKKLIEQEKVCAVIGEVLSTSSLTAAPICQRARVPMVTPCSTNPRVTREGDYIFRVCFTDDFQGYAAAVLAYQKLAANRAAVLMDQSGDYSKGLSEVFSQWFQKFGGTIVTEESYVQRDSDFRPQLTSIKQVGADVIYVPGYYQEVGPIVKQARELGITQPLIGGDGWDSPKVIEIAGAAARDCYYTNHYSPDDPRAAEFVAAYKAEYAKVPDALAALGYDAVGVVADAINRAGKADPKAIRDALADTKGFKGATGEITMDAERNPTKGAVVLAIRQTKQGMAPELYTEILPLLKEKKQ